MGYTPSDFERLLHFLAHLTGTDVDTVLVSTLALLMKTHRIDFEEKFIFGVYVAGTDDVLVKEDEDGKHYIRMFSVKRLSSRIPELR